MTTHDDGTRPPRIVDGHEKIVALERRLNRLEDEFADFKQQHRADMASVRQVAESKERVIEDLRHQIQDLKRKQGAT